MKKIYSLITILFVTLGFAQNSTKNTLEVNSIPAGYYDTAIGTGYTLKTQLKTIITSGHTDRGYGSGSTLPLDGLWLAYETTDRDNNIGYDNDNTIVDMYSENPTGTDPYTFDFRTEQCGSNGPEGACYNREHLVPQAYFDHFQTNPMKNDPHHVVPTDSKVNGWRDNWPFGVVGNVTTSPCNSGASNTPCNTLNGSKKGNNINSGYASGFSGTVFEPVDEFKGDIARCVLYFATRYEDLMDNFYSGATVASKAMFDGSTDQVLSPTFLNILLTWHKQDPVSIKETRRNDAIYAFQGNRNPYIDHPEYVCQIWSTACAALSNGEVLLAETDFNIYPNPSNGTFRIDYDTTIGNIDVEIYSTLGQKVFEKQNIDNHIITTNGLQSGVYLLKITNESRSTFKKIIIN